MTAELSYCWCKHAQQVHGANADGNLEHGGPRGEGRCSACWCPSFSPAKDRVAA